MADVAKHIVVGVDDDFRVRESIESLVESAGYAPLVFPSAEQFLQSGTLAGATCLITDVRMPGMDGIELQRAHQPAVPNRHLYHVHQQRIAGFRSVAVCLGLLECRQQSREFALGDREDDLLLRAELVVDSRFGDPDGVSDHLQRGSADAVLGEQVQRGIEHASPGGTVLYHPQLPVGNRLPCCFHTTRLDERLLTRS